MSGARNPARHFEPVGSLLLNVSQKPSSYMDCPAAILFFDPVFADPCWNIRFGAALFFRSDLQRAAVGDACPAFCYGSRPVFLRGIERLFGMENGKSGEKWLGIFWEGDWVR